MAVFQSPKGFQFSPDGSVEKAWAHFRRVPRSWPAVFEFTTDDAEVIDKLRHIELRGVEPIRRIDPPQGWPSINDTTGQK